MSKNRDETGRIKRIELTKIIIDAMSAMFILTFVAFVVVAEAGYAVNNIYIGKTPAVIVLAFSEIIPFPFGVVWLVSRYGPAIQRRCNGINIGSIRDSY